MARGIYTIIYIIELYFVVLSFCGDRKGVTSQKPGVPAVFDGGQWYEIDERDGKGDFVPYPPITDSYKSNDTTIMATNPKRVYAGVVQQNDKGDIDCFYDYCRRMKETYSISPLDRSIIKKDTDYYRKDGSANERLVKNVMENCPYQDQIFMLRTSSSDAKGPTYGRHLGSKLIDYEKHEFCMQIDAHMDVVKDWDHLLLQQWGMIENEYGILTTYVQNLPDLGKNVNLRYEVPHICRVYFNGNAMMPRNEQAKAAINLKRPKMTSTWAAGFAFGKCHGEKKTPYDPHLPSLFDGEEFSKYARLWTRGYDTYSPHRSYVFHDYNHRAETKTAENWSRKNKELKQSADRLKTLIGISEAPVLRNSTQAHLMLKEWDLGNKRTLEQLQDFTGINMKTREIKRSSCAMLNWVPFVEGDDDDSRGPDGYTGRQEKVKEIKNQMKRIEEDAKRKFKDNNLKNHFPRNFGQPSLIREDSLMIPKTQGSIQIPKTHQRPNSENKVEDLGTYRIIVMFILSTVAFTVISCSWKNDTKKLRL